MLILRANACDTNRPTLQGLISKAGPCAEWPRDYKPNLGQRKDNMEFLKEHLGEELYAQVAEKLKGTKLKLADLSTGGYISKDKFDAQTEQLKAAQSATAARDTQLAELKKLGDPVQMQTEIARLQEQNKKDAEAANAKFTALAYDHALNEALLTAKAKNTKAVAALLNRDAIKLVDGQLVGLKEQLETVRKDNGYLFADVPPPKGGEELPGAINTPGMNEFIRRGT